jgi:hypothetical protein
MEYADSDKHTSLLYRSFNYNCKMFHVTSPWDGNSLGRLLALLANVTLGWSKLTDKHLYHGINYSIKKLLVCWYAPSLAC